MTSEILSIVNFFGLVALSIFVLARHFSTHKVTVAPLNTFTQQDSPATDDDYDADQALEEWVKEQTQDPSINGMDQIFDEMEIVKK